MSSLDVESYKVSPLKRRDIREIAALVRSTLGYKDPELDIIELLELRLPHVMPKVFLTTDEDHKFEPSEYARTYIGSQRIVLREDVYLGACNGNPFHRFTCAHELGHLLLHKEPALKRTHPRRKLKPYECSEWQADCFAGELLVSADMARGCRSPSDIAEKFNVTISAAKYQYGILAKDGYV